MAVITISREFGSERNYIELKVAEALGISDYIQAQSEINFRALWGR